MTTQKQTKSQPRKLRGWATYEGDEFAFRPQEPGEPTQLNVRTTTGGKVFNTTSAKKPLQVAHLSCPADSPDPWQEYTSQLKKLGIKPLKEQKVSEKQRLVNEGGMQVFLNATQGQLTYQGCIDLSKGANWQSELMRQLQLVVRTLPVQERFNKVLTSLKKKGGKK